VSVNAMSAATDDVSGVFIFKKSPKAQCQNSNSRAFL
jgi:hypothetical protein